MLSNVLGITGEPLPMKISPDQSVNSTTKNPNSGAVIMVSRDAHQIS